MCIVLTTSSLCYVACAGNLAAHLLLPYGLFGSALAGIGRALLPL